MSGAERTRKTPPGRPATGEPGGHRELKEKLMPQPVPGFELDLGRMRSAEEVERQMCEAVPGSFE